MQINIIVSTDAEHTAAHSCNSPSHMPGNNYFHESTIVFFKKLFPWIRTVQIKYSITKKYT